MKDYFLIFFESYGHPILDCDVLQL